MSKKIRIFCWYAEDDKHHFDNFLTYMRSIEDQKNIHIWYKQNIALGTKPAKEIEKNLNAAHIVLLFLSQTFMVSNDCRDITTKTFHLFNTKNSIRVIPILLRDCVLNGTEFEHLLILPRNRVSIASESKSRREKSLISIVNEIAQTIDKCSRSSISPSDLNLPSGWKLLKQEYLERRRTELTTEEILRYVDGGMPNWQLALSSQIPRRGMVAILHKIIEETHLSDLGVTVLLGGGGEGKSTVLRQTICDLPFGTNTWNILWREDENASLSTDMLRKLPSGEGAWLIASDNADQLATDVYNALKLLREDRRKDIHFLLCCREIDWKGVDANKYLWHSYSKYTEQYLKGLTPSDANLIITLWSQFGDKVLGKLAGRSPDEATNILMQNAQSELSKADGSFLGAMLTTRYPGKALEERVLALLRQIQNLDHTFGRSLYRVYTYIVALHAEKQFLLTKDVLAYTLQCSVNEIQTFLGLLEREAATATRPSGSTTVISSNKYIFARHTAIAKCAVQILSKSFYTDFEEVYAELFTSAIEIFKDGGNKSLPDIKKWRSLPEYFFDRGKKEIAFRLATLSVKLEPHDPLHILLLSRLYQNDEQFEQGAEIFRDTFEDLAESRKDTLYYHEWATAEGKAKNHAVSAWLDGIALADNIPQPRREDNYNPADHIIIALDGMSIDFEHLFDRTGDPTFQYAWITAIKLGLLFEGTNKTANARKRLLQSQQKYLHSDTKNLTLVLNNKYIQNGIVAAWKLRERELHSNVRQGRELTFQKLDTFQKQALNARPLSKR